MAQSLQSVQSVQRLTISNKAYPKLPKPYENKKKQRKKQILSRECPDGLVRQGHSVESIVFVCFFLVFIRFGELWIGFIGNRKVWVQVAGPKLPKTYDFQ